MEETLADKIALGMRPTGEVGEIGASTALQSFLATFATDGADDALHAMIEQLPLACLIKDEDLRYLIANEHYRALCHLKGHGLIGRTAWDFFPTEKAELFESKEKHVLETGVEQKYQEAFDHPDGQQTMTITSVKRLIDDHGRRYICITFFDVTELLEAKRRAQSADDLKTKFLANVSHELRTPLNGVLGLAQLLKIKDLTPEQEQIVDVIISSGETLIKVISDILDFSMMEADQVRLIPERFSVETLVEDIAALMTPLAEQSGLRLIHSSGPSPPRWGYGDVGRIRQIVSNFVSNAIKFTNEGYIELRFDGDVAKNELHISVKDTGIGLSECEQQMIFERFKRSKALERAPRPGLGLGLSICQSLAEMMGGRLSLRSALGEGSLFQVHLPLVADGGKDLDMQESSPPTYPVEIIDDFEPRRRGWTERLQAMGYPIRSGGDGNARVRIVSYEADDLTGDALAANLAAIHEVTPAVVTLPQNHGDLCRLFNDAGAGAVKCILRPGSSNHLRSAIAELGPLLNECGTFTTGD